MDKPRQAFTDEQQRWLEMIRDHVVANLSIERDDFAYVPFAQEGGIGKVYLERVLKRDMTALFGVRNVIP
ncbi:type I restriction-modification enzyme R subunit C-terminal domain-containing protein [Geobacter sp.]|uniref:type I restriction-modification enzyme R subunit C-terminal domain-containing protein n=1 Tax=Geobacter sp. TaxID=46610 RepID=UPI0026029BA0|nr:type I restriction-modification enzyme R subunit C-terminal domain-containing protein [Geobacter sp.]